MAQSKAKTKFNLVRSCTYLGIMRTINFLHGRNFSHYISGTYLIFFLTVANVSLITNCLFLWSLNTIAFYLLRNLNSRTHSYFYNCGNNPLLKYCKCSSFLVFYNYTLTITSPVKFSLLLWCVGKTSLFFQLFNWLFLCPLNTIQVWC